MTENTAKRAGIRKIPEKSHRALEDYQLLTYGHDRDHATHFRYELQQWPMQHQRNEEMTEKRLQSYAALQQCFF